MRETPSSVTSFQGREIAFNPCFGECLLLQSNSNFQTCIDEFEQFNALEVVERLAEIDPETGLPKIFAIRQNFLPNRRKPTAVFQYLQFGYLKAMGSYSDGGLTKFVSGLNLDDAMKIIERIRLFSSDEFNRLFSAETKMYCFGKPSIRELLQTSFDEKDFIKEVFFRIIPANVESNRPYALYLMFLNNRRQILLPTSALSIFRRSGVRQQVGESKNYTDIKFQDTKNALIKTRIWSEVEYLSNTSDVADAPLSDFVQVLLGFYRVSDIESIFDINDDLIRKTGLPLQKKNSTVFFAYYEKLRKKTYRDTGHEIPSLSVDRTVSHRVNLADGTFNWVVERNRSLVKWVHLAAEYIQSADNKRTQNPISMLNHFFRYLLSLDKPPLCPEDLVRCLHINKTKSTPSDMVPLVVWVDEHVSASSKGSVINHFKYLLAHYHDAHNPDWIPPLTERDSLRNTYSAKGGGKTVRSALPVSIINLAKAILTEDDYAWPKANFDDYVKTSSGDSWCPVRTVGLITLFTLPIRYDSLVTSDSGEGDQLHLESDFTWVEKESYEFFNGNPRNFGVFRRIYDSETLRYMTGFYFLNNKTKDAWAPGKDWGTRIPWENKELLGHLIRLRDWQQEFNPISKPVHFNELDKRFHVPKIHAGLAPTFYPLFRDPLRIKGESNKPISTYRFLKGYLLLLAEVERRVNDELKSDGSSEQVTLIDKWNGSVPKSAIWDIHTLRVSGITALALAGVPASIIAEFVAGHATILMNIYYQKYGISLVSKILLEGIESLGDVDVRDDIAQLLDDTQSFRASVIATDAAFHSLKENQPHFWMQNLDGLCPNNMTLCHKGGTVLDGGSYKLETPVKGGEGACGNCKFWVTGPLFLNGQIIRLNRLFYEIKELSESERAADLKLGSALFPSDKKRIYAEKELIRRRLDSLLEEWVNRLSLAKQSLHMLNANRTDEAGENEKLPLISDFHGSAKIQFEEGREFELLEVLSRVGEFYPSFRSSSVDLRRSKIIDRMMAANGLNPFLFSLDEEESKRCASKLTYFLYKSASLNDVTKLMNCDISLKDLGISINTQDILSVAIEIGDRKKILVTNKSKKKVV